MKKLKQIVVGVFCLVVLNAAEANAAFPIKHETVNQVQNQQPTNSMVDSKAQVQQTKTAEMKVLKTKKDATAKTIPQGLYIVLAIFWMGWLAMGINDDFHGNDWLISLLLYIIFYIPGLIYTLVKMNKYY
ncbi:MAG: YqaE/Pmp3 family membrane protein [Chitinophagaceae bacterium]|jgi:uncharacterized membrane protein YqaE (UPF0057 family)